MFSIKNLRVFGPIGALLCLFASVQLFSLVHAAREANQVDSEKTELALKGALKGQSDRIAGIASDNAYWDDAASAVYRSHPDLDFVRRSWGDSTADGINYDGAYLLDPSLRTVIGLRDGKHDPVPIEAHIGPDIAMLSERSQAGAGIGGIVQMPEGPALVGLSQILPTSPGTGLKIPRDGPYRLLFVKRLDPALLGRMGGDLVIHDLRIISDREASPRLAVKGLHGNPIAWLTWSSDNPGVTALRRALPPIGAAMIAALVLTLMIGRQSLRSVNDLARQAMVDSLSGLPNRRALRRELRRRIGSSDGSVLCLLDLDGFKFINDNYGHAVGDHLIVACSEMLHETIGKDGFIARLGGDEFAFVLSGADAAKRARAIADEVLGRMAQPFQVGERTVLIGVSIGLALEESAVSDADEMLRRADVAMYAAKRAGKMRVCEFDRRLDQRQARIHLIENELRSAIISRNFRLAYQPVFDSGKGTITSVEALIRWISPTLGELDPIDFIPIAEETGLINPMGLHILQMACEETRDWGDMRVAVNVSAAQLRNPDFPDHVRQILERTGFPASRLELEITETYLVHDPELAGRVLNGLRAIGVSIALDDFGTGYASIGFLRQFEFDKLKIDRSLVMDAENSDTARALLQASVAMARALDIEVVAEGVETSGQADLMRIAGCDQLQGWLFDKAMTPDEILRLLAEQRAAEPISRTA